MIDTIRALRKASESCSWSRFVMWHSDNTIGGKDTVLKFGEGEDSSAADAIDAVGICEEEISTLSSLERCDPVICDLILAARALALMNREVLFVNGVDGFRDGKELQQDFNEWLKDYSAAWLRDDKPSGLPRLQKFIEHITEVPTK